LLAKGARRNNWNSGPPKTSERSGGFPSRSKLVAGFCTFMTLTLGKSIFRYKLFRHQIHKIVRN